MTAADATLADVMAEMPYGLYIVGSHAADGEPNGMMADWVMQVSFAPRLVAVSFENDAHTLENIRDAGAFTINLLGADHDGMELARGFAEPYLNTKVASRGATTKARAHRKLTGLAYARTSRGCPVLDSAFAWMECEAQHFYPVGDHTLVVGRVVDGAVLRDVEPLTSEYTGWPYSG
jgi:flavin reductase (DIM6/NTAB) family NADH-FMN oxidoreductase RutF